MARFQSLDHGMLHLAGASHSEDDFLKLEWGLVKPARPDHAPFLLVAPFGRLAQQHGLVDLCAGGAVAVEHPPNGARLATLAEARGVPGPIALQTQYSLVERSADYEHLPAARELQIGVQAWSPLAGGFLSGKYRREDGKPSGEGRLSGDNPLGQSPFSERNWDILDALRNVADAVGRGPADVALAWASMQRGIGSVLIGASRLDQLERNVAALDVTLSPDQLETLDEASQPPDAFPGSGFVEPIRRSIFGGANVLSWRA